MKLELFNNGAAMFAERTPTQDLKIEVNGEGYLHVGDKVYPIKNGVAAVGKLPPGEYSISVVGKNKLYRAIEHLIISDTGVAYIDNSHLWEYVLELEERFQLLKEAVDKLERKQKEHERKINGPSLFGN